MKAYAGIDLHSTNSFVGILNERDKKLYGERLPNDLHCILKALAPFKDDLEAVIVESTYNWYWLVDGLREAGYNVDLANPSAMKQYEGLKFSNDKSDSFWLARQKLLGILPVGYIYPKEERPIRDLLRRRLLFVRHRTSHILSLQSMITRNLNKRFSANHIKTLKQEDLKELFSNEYLGMESKCQLETIHSLQSVIGDIEKKVKSQIKLKIEFEMLTTTPGIGNILGLTIMLEVGDIHRFKKVGNYSSYCRCVKSERQTNDKKKGEGNRKNGNKYLSWAYVEAANFCIRFCPQAEKYYQRKAAKTKKVIAIKALSNKLARASYYIMRDKVPFDVDKLFG